MTTINRTSVAPYQPALADHYGTKRDGETSGSSTADKFIKQDVKAQVRLVTDERVLARVSERSRQAFEALEAQHLARINGMKENIRQTENGIARLNDWSGAAIGSMARLAADLNESYQHSLSEFKAELARLEAEMRGVEGSSNDDNITSFFNDSHITGGLGNDRISTDGGTVLFSKGDGNDQVALRGYNGQITTLRIQGYRADEVSILKLDGEILIKFAGSEDSIKLVGAVDRALIAFDDGTSFGVEDSQKLVSSTESQFSTEEVPAGHESASGPTALKDINLSSSYGHALSKNSEKLARDEYEFYNS